MGTKIKTVIILYSLLFFYSPPLAQARDGELVYYGQGTLGSAANSFELASVMLAQKSKKKKQQQTDSGFRDTDPVPGNPHPVGKGKIVTGIVIASVGGGVGVGLITYSIFNYCPFYTYGVDEEEAKTREAECKKTNQIYLISGIASTALGLGIGLPKLFEGMKERRIWKQWNRDNAKRKNSSTETRTLYHYNVFLAPQAESKTLAMGISFNY